MVGDGMEGRHDDVNQGTTVGGAKRPAGVRAPVVAKKRVTIVEPRGAGRRWYGKVEGLKLHGWESAARLNTQ
jgi:hypothetical protein